MKRIVILLSLLIVMASAFGAEPFQVVVNANNPVRELSRATVRSYFLGSATRWPDGSMVKPIDLVESSPAREQFSKSVLGKSVGAVKSHWLTLVFAGRGNPPVQLDSEEKVLAMIRANGNAIGYVSGSAGLGSGVKAISMTD